MPEDISLLPKEVERKKEQEARERLLRKASLIFLVVSLALGASSLIYSSVLRLQLSKLEQNMASEKSKISSLSEIELKAQDLEVRVGALKDIFDEKAYFSTLLTTLSGAVPADVSITEMTVPSEETVSVSGGSRSYVSLANFLLNLKETKIFEMVDLRSVSLDQQTGEVKFDLNLKLAKGGLKQ